MDFLRARPDVAIEVLTVMGQRQRVSTEMLRAMKNPNEVFEKQLSGWQKVNRRFFDPNSGIMAKIERSLGH